ncbi:MAG: DNA-binding protein [Ramlibacter sp.]|nr:DNA-binding protein [Ramlibacter sp.]
MHIEVLRLSPGDDLRAALERAYTALAQAHGVQAGCVVSAVGSLQGAVLRYADQDTGTAISGPLELLTLSGTFSANGPHLHASVSRADGTVLGGHLLAGCTVRTTAEVVLALLPQWQFSRQVDAATGYAELVATRRAEGDQSGR